MNVYMNHGESECQGVLEKALRNRDWVTVQDIARRLEELDGLAACAAEPWLYSEPVHSEFEGLADDLRLPEYWAAVGTDGRDPVIWGLGGSAVDAEDDAIVQIRDVEGEPTSTDDAYVDGYWDERRQELRTCRISRERADLVKAGTVRADDLWETR